MSPDLLSSRGRVRAEPPTTPAPTSERALRLDRERIARDLHDHVLQRLFAAGLATQRVARGLTEGDSSASLERVVVMLDDTIREIRATVFDLAGPLGPERGSVSDRLASVASGLAGVLGFEPTIHFHGPVDDVPEGFVSDLVAVVREGLINTARHAGADYADVKVVATDGSVLVRLRDDGVGVGEVVRTSGLTNLRVRAERRGGSLRVLPGSSAEPAHRKVGTCLLWSAPLR
jgi:signal transduction histidine kinase